MEREWILHEQHLIILSGIRAIDGLKSQEEIAKKMVDLEQKGTLGWF